ncbi:MAG: riboflavin synthase [Deltaproteobacteria bacterium]|nr:MAG: riboflavin synthase [Deltaproteobacteria bacterium]
MFTGIIEAVGTVLGVKAYGKGYELKVDSSLDLSGEKVGDSIAVDGVCLTVTSIDKGVFSVIASQETLSRSTLSLCRPGQKVNIERALRLFDRLGGHIVLGHVDTMGQIKEKTRTGESTGIKVTFDKRFAKYVIEKGSVAIDGISLTINSVEDSVIEVNIIPHTAVSTSLTLKRPGDSVNIEFDILGKYVESLLGHGKDKRLEDLLKKQGMM